MPCEPPLSRRVALLLYLAGVASYPVLCLLDVADRAPWVGALGRAVLALAGVAAWGALVWMLTA